MGESNVTPPPSSATHKHRAAETNEFSGTCRFKHPREFIAQEQKYSYPFSRPLALRQLRCLLFRSQTSGNSFIHINLVLKSYLTSVYLRKFSNIPSSIHCINEKTFSYPIRKQCASKTETLMVNRSQTAFRNERGPPDVDINLHLCRILNSM